MSHCFLIVFFIHEIEIYEGFSGFSFHSRLQKWTELNEKRCRLETEWNENKNIHINMDILFPLSARYICIKNDKKRLWKLYHCALSVSFMKMSEAVQLKSQKWEKRTNMKRSKRKKATSKFKFVWFQKSCLHFHIVLNICWMNANNNSAFASSIKWTSLLFLTSWKKRFRLNYELAVAFHIFRRKLFSILFLEF